MEFTVYYTSTKPVPTGLRTKIEETVESLNNGHSWLSCEPVGFFSEDDEGRWIGGSKPIFDEVYEDDIAFGEKSGLPHGNLDAVVEILSKISSQYRVNWEFSHDYSDGPIGTIQDGRCDDELTQALSELSDIDGDE